MAFHEAWDEDPKRTWLRPLLLWGGPLSAGAALGLIGYLLLSPGGALHPLLLPQPSPSAAPTTTVNAAAEPGPTATACPAEPPAAHTALTSFVQELNRDKIQQAWARLSLSLQQSLYAGNVAAFERDWGTRGQIQLGHITLTHPAEGQALLLANLTFERPQRSSFEYNVRLRYASANCRWLIEELSLPTPSEPTATFPPSPTP